MIDNCTICNFPFPLWPVHRFPTFLLFYLLSYSFSMKFNVTKPKWKFDWQQVLAAKQILLWGKILAAKLYLKITKMWHNFFWYWCYSLTIEHLTPWSNDCLTPIHQYLALHCSSHNLVPTPSNYLSEHRTLCSMLSVVNLTPSDTDLWGMILTAENMTQKLSTKTLTGWVGVGSLGGWV